MQPRIELEFALVDLRDPARMAEVRQLWEAAYAAELHWHRTWLQAWPDPALQQIDYPSLQSRLARLQVSTTQLWGAWARLDAGAVLSGGTARQARLVGTLGVDKPDAAAECRVSSLHVDPVCHGQGVARALVGALLQATHEGMICAHVPVGNAAARVALGRMGFLWHRQFNSTTSGLPMLELHWHRRQVDAHAPIHIRQLLPNEHQLHRAIRLRALRADPDAFGEQYPLLAAESDDFWQALTAGVTSPASGAMYVAEIGGRICGAVYATLTSHAVSAASQHAPHVAAIVAGLWVDSSQRRRGAARALMAGVLEWAHARGVRELRAWAPMHRADAGGLAAALGFIEHEGAAPIRSVAETPLWPIRRAFVSGFAQATELDG